ncbi:MAG: DNRLRE domain-containing protein [Verrucomicrobiota bacterium]
MKSLLLLARGALLALAFVSPLVAATATITNPPGSTTAWTDTSGNRIANNSGCILQDGGTFYWYGFDPLTNTVNCYTSTTLGSGSWTKVTTGGFPMFGSGWHGRPDVIKHPTNGTYVMVLEGKPGTGNPGRNAIDYYTATSPTGPFTFAQKDFQAMLNNTGGWVNMGDKGLYQDEDVNKTAYLLCTTDDGGTPNSTTKIIKLNPNYIGQQSVIQSSTSPSPKREALAMFKRNGVFYLLSSHTAGWSSSPTTYKTATSIAGTWSASWMAVPTNPAGSPDSFDTQHDFILRIVGTTATSFIYLGDRWGRQLAPGDTSKVNNSAFFPLTFDAGGVPTLKGDASWTIDAVTGIVNGAPQTLTFTAVKDAHVREFYPTTNYGTGTQLIVNANPSYRKQCYLQFNVTGLPAGATIQSATLLVTAQTTTTRAVTAKAVSSTTWSETGINWSNKPALGATLATDSTHTVGVDSQWNVSAHVTGNGNVSFALDTPDVGDTFFDSREVGGANAPTLVVVYQP